MTNRKAIDLHMHTTHSDAACTPAELLVELEENDVGIFSFTDHDSVDCYHDLAAGKIQLYPDVILIPGMEVTCNRQGMTRDMLGYGLDIDVVQAYLDTQYSFSKRLEKQQHVLEQLIDNCRRLDLRLDADLSVSEGKKSEAIMAVFTSLNHFPENVERFPFIANITRFFWDHLANPNSRFFIDETYDLPDFSAAVSLIHKAGGLAFLAHPFAYGLPDEERDVLVQDAVDAGIDGIECQHNSIQPGNVEQILTYAKRYGLYISGGSDYHGSFKPGLHLVTAYDNVQVQFAEISPWFDQVQKIVSPA